MTISLVEETGEHLQEASILIWLNNPLVRLLQERITDHEEEIKSVNLRKVFYHKKQLVSICLKNRIDPEAFLEKKSFDDILRSDNMPSKDEKNNIKHIINSFLQINTILDDGHLIYEARSNRFHLPHPVLNTPTPDVSEYFSSLNGILDKCFAIIGCKEITT